MSAIYFAIPTNVGQAKIANAIALGVPLKITAMGVGDGGGQPVTPDPAMTALPGEQRRAPINTLFQDPLNPSQLVAEQILPEDVGGWWVRCVGLYDETGTLIAIANAPDTYKPLLTSGSGRTQTIRIVLIVSNTSAVELKIDPAVVLATRKYVDEVALSSYPVGAPIPWPTAVPPTGYITMTGQSFSAATYPKLAIAYPSLVLPDMRAEFIRGWDGGRGIDTGRAILGTQVSATESHTHRVTTGINTDSTRDQNGNLSSDPLAVKSINGASIVQQTSTRVESFGGSETRPRNIAFNYIVRAA